MFQFLLLIITIVALMINADAAAQEEGTIFDKFDGTINDTSSWFDPSRWTNILKVPTSIDTVWIDESNTYVAIDSDSEVAAAEVYELIIGRSGSSNSMENVQVDLLEDATLNVVTNMIIGQYLESDAIVYASHNSQINIGETLTIGGGVGGSGVIILSGNAQIIANDITICENNGCKLIMDDDSKLTLNGKGNGNGNNMKDKLDEMIQQGLIVFSSSSSFMLEQQDNKKEFQVTYDESNSGKTIVKIIDVDVLFNDVGKEEVCKDLKLKYQGKKKKNCKWIAKKNKCNKDFNGNSIANYWCQSSCNTCTATRDDNEPPTGSNSNEDVNDCKDLKLKYKGKNNWCKWASKKNKCKKKHKGKSIGNHWCKESCQQCPPISNNNTVTTI